MQTQDEGADQGGVAGQEDALLLLLHLVEGVRSHGLLPQAQIQPAAASRASRQEPRKERGEIRERKEEGRAYASNERMRAIPHRLTLTSASSRLSFSSSSMRSKRSSRSAISGSKADPCPTQWRARGENDIETERDRFTKPQPNRGPRDRREAYRLAEIGRRRVRVGSRGGIRAETARGLRGDKNLRYRGHPIPGRRLQTTTTAQRAGSAAEKFMSRACHKKRGVTSSRGTSIWIWNGARSWERLTPLRAVPASLPPASK